MHLVTAQASVAGWLLAAVSVAATGCGGSSPAAHRCEVPTEPLSVRHGIPVATHGWNLAVIVQNTAGESRRIRVSLGGRRALDVTMPASPGCNAQSAEPMSEFHFAVSRGRVAVAVASSGGTRRTGRIVVPRHGRRWLLVTDYDPRRLGLILHTYERRPLWG